MPARTMSAILPLAAVVVLNVAAGCRSSRCQTCSESVSYHDAGSYSQAPAPQPAPGVPGNNDIQPSPPNSNVPPPQDARGPSLRSRSAYIPSPTPDSAFRQSPDRYNSSQTFVVAPSVFDKIRNGFRRLRTFRIGRRRTSVAPTPMGSELQPQPDPYFPQGNSNSRPAGFGAPAEPSSVMPSVPAPARSIPQSTREARVPQQSVPQSEIDVEAWPYAKDEPRQSVAQQSRDGVYSPKYRPALHGLSEHNSRRDRLSSSDQPDSRRPAGYLPAKTYGQDSVALARRRAARTPGYARSYRSISHGDAAHSERHPPRSGADPASEFSSASPASSPFAAAPIRSRNFR